MSTILENSIWPNTDPEGPLGIIKVQIPDGINTLWPDGDALIGNVVYKNGLISGFVDTKALTVNESKSTTFPYDYVNIQVDKSLEGVMTFNKGERTKHLIITYTESDNTGDVVVFKYKDCKTVADIIAVDPNYLTNDIIDGTWSESLADLEDGYSTKRMFEGASLGKFIGDLSSLKDGFQMFRNSELKVFNAKLPNLMDGRYMFENCSNLNFYSDLSNLSPEANVDGMFYKTFYLKFDASLSNLEIGNTIFKAADLRYFKSNLSSLIQHNNMFSNLTLLYEFTASLSSLENGENMFLNCSNLYRFESNLSSLTNGKNMFLTCNLDADSVLNVLNSINTVEDGVLTLGLGCPNNEMYPIESFLEKINFSSVDSLLNAFKNKGWNVELVFNSGNILE